MKMTLRWFGSGYDSVSLAQIRQIPGVTGVITTLYGIPAGESWPADKIAEMKDAVSRAGLKVEGIESVNVHESIKTGAPNRDRYIENYIDTLKSLGEQDIRLVCYNFMPVFDWTRSELSKPREDGSFVLAYDSDVIDKIEPDKVFDKSGSTDFVMPGWEPERLEKIKELFEAYRDIDSESLFENLVYFLRRIEPVCEEYGIRMAIHPDDPAWPIFGLPRIINNRDNIARLLHEVDRPFNGLAFCTGSIGSDPNNDVCGMIREFGSRIYFAHVRNLRHTAPGKFEEAAHLSADGSFDMYKIVRTLYETGFDGPIRPDHGRMIWGEKAIPGYGLYDRALGAAYLNGLIEAIEKQSLKK